jgi:branched-chain amino acid transport system permease protein
MIMIIFALSLDLALGYGGIETLGHAAFFGIGGYAAGLYALHVSDEPLTGLVIGGLSAGLFGVLSGFLILRARGLALIMLTIALATMLLELANALRWLTGGDDGLRGYSVAPIFGYFEFDFLSRTAYFYGFAVAIIAFLVSRLIVNSQFGLTVRGIKGNQVRMELLGVPVLSRLITLYAISGTMAGIAGALSAQVTGLVGLNALSFVISGNVLIVLVLGGVGRLYGAILGAIVFVVLSDRAAAVDPFNWFFALGFALILVVWLAPDGIAGLFETGWNRIKPGGKAR